MIDKLLGRDTIEEITDDVQEKPAEYQAPVLSSSGLTIKIIGLWAGMAGDYNPKTTITVPVDVDNIFYRIESSGSGFGEQRHITKVFLNDHMIMHENGTIKEGDPIDTGVIPVPSTIKESGMVGKIIINLESWDGKILYVSPEFLVNVQ